MSGEFEAAGEIVTGGLIGRAVEPRAGEGHGEGSLCLNCGTALIGPNCHRCGQSAHVHRSLGAIGHEILHGVAHFEGKLWRTLPLLAWRPGELTRRYVEGERARFVSPMALFLFSIFTMFAVFQIVGLQPPSDINTGTGTTALIEQMRKDAVEERADAIEARDKRKAGDPRRARYEKRITEAEATIRQLDAIPKAAVTNAPRVTDLKTGWYALDHGVEKWNKNPSLMLYKLQTSVYKFSWLLIPLSLPFVWLLFCWKRQYRLYDHTVFITYSIAFMSLLFIVITLASAIGVPAGWIIAASLLVPPIHLFRQLQQAYSLKPVSAVMRTIVMLWFITIIVSIFLTILVVMGLLG
ncbi:DUF3667 domain-containing protein [Sphingomonas sp. AOB5]|uniref:DUF3667 domain-containing protein n=1 Tax=Sphingomonas sp. AOB5 TaxID=3034017 RepID=UPI0023F99F20|nr:DUF3667 domain-containing protein [Sphingomonas sp. AOB5]MDF7777784.1 DUF3667 domain-containing protein [Sphingomonas sp. AOB5]